MKEDAGWGGTASFPGKLFDFVHWFRYEGYFKGLPVTKYTYVACLKVLLCVRVCHLMVCLYLWFTGRKRIQNPVKHIRWSFLLN